jgi:hypothetical protein
MMNFEHGKIRCTKPVVLKNNFNLPVSFSPQVIYDVTKITLRPNGADFTCSGRFFRDVDLREQGIEWVSSQNVD